VLSAPEAYAGNLDAVEFNGQWRRRVESSDWTPAQSHDMTLVLDEDTVDINITQIRPPNDEPVFPASSGKRRSSLVSEPDPGCRRRQQQPGLVKLICPDLRDIATAVMQSLVIFEKYPGSLGEPPEGRTQADDDPIAAGEPDVAQSLQRRRQANTRCVVGA
jgi:hypothetical protein